MAITKAKMVTFTAKPDMERHVTSVFTSGGIVAYVIPGNFAYAQFTSSRYAFCTLLRDPIPICLSRFAALTVYYIAHNILCRVYCTIYLRLVSTTPERATTLEGTCHPLGFRCALIQ